MSNPHRNGPVIQVIVTAIGGLVGGLFGLWIMPPKTPQLLGIDPISARRRPRYDRDMKIPAPMFGWLIGLSIIGAMIGYAAAEVTPDRDHDLRASREARLKTSERRIPFVVTGCVLGAIAGMIGERRLGQQNAHLLKSNRRPHPKM